MDGRERDFKTNGEQWKVIIEYFKQYPFLLKNKFTNSDGDKLKSKEVWTKLCEHLNSMGCGKRTVEKWQNAIGRWKSKTKLKASLLRKEMEKTGGGPCKTPSLTHIEEQLMGLMGWKSITGDGNVELGFASKTPIIEIQQIKPQVQTVQTLHSINSMATIVGAHQHIPSPSTSRDFLDVPPPLVPMMKDGIKRPFEPQIVSNQPENKPKKAKIRKTTEKTRKFVNMHAMHKENQEQLKNIEKNTKVIADALETIKDTFVTYVNCLMTK